MITRAATPTNHQDSPAGILYLCYLGIDEPLVQTQVIPYLRGLAAAGHRVVLLTFEPSVHSPSRWGSHRSPTLGQGLEWHRLRYHKRPALPATVMDIMAGIIYGARLMHTKRLDAVHARGHVPAVMAVALKWLRGATMVFDIRGLLADEYVDAGLWKRGGILYRAAKRIEAILLAKADGAVVLTRRAGTWLAAQRPADAPGVPIEVIPCCVDISRFQTDHARIDALRAGMGFGQAPVLVYAGKFGGWYMASEMVEFFQAAKRRFPDLRFLVLTQSDTVLIEAEMARRKILPRSYRCLTVSPEELPVYLGAATFAVSFIQPWFSKMAASPTKMAEYLAAGLPVVYNAGIGDLDELEPERIGARITSFAPDDYEAAVRQIRVLIRDRQTTAMRCRAVAERCFSLAAVGVPRYARLYDRLAERHAGRGRSTETGGRAVPRSRGAAPMLVGRRSESGGDPC